MGMQGLAVGMQGLAVGMQGLAVGMQGLAVACRGLLWHAGACCGRREGHCCFLVLFM